MPATTHYHHSNTLTGVDHTTRPTVGGPKTSVWVSSTKSRVYMLVSVSNIFIMVILGGSQYDKSFHAKHDNNFYKIHLIRTHVCNNIVAVPHLISILD